ncbi:MAG: hypothetical protein ACOCU6_02790 [Nanoarchaeota archaeon]
MAITNKTLSVLLIAAIVVSIGGTFFSLTMLQAPTGAPTGYATGTVDLDVPDQLSITLDDSVIEMGSCTPSKTSGEVIFVDSSQGSSAANNGNCSGGTFPDNMTIRNNGNVDALITVSSNSGGDDLFGNTEQNGFGIKAESNDGGCVSGLLNSYENFTHTGGSTETVCTNLQSHNTDNSMELYAGAWITPTATSGENSVDWTITASAAS